MAEESEDQDQKEFDPTEQRLQQAREEGNVAQSKEANALAVIIGIVISAYVLYGLLGQSLFEDFSSILYHGDMFAKDAFETGGTAVWGWLGRVLLHLLPIFLIMAAIVLAALIVQRSIVFSFKKIALDMNKISPVRNIQNRYDARGLLDFVKDAVKLIFAGVIGTAFLMQFVETYYTSAEVQKGDFYEFTFNQVLLLILYFLAFQVVLAVIDLPLQRQLHLGKLKMTREEMKKEMKQSEGDPHLKQMRREKATKISRGDLVKGVKSATLVMVNPTHYAVALKWDPESQKAPICVAKGVDNLAAKIREIAAENKIPIYSDPPATRSLYKLVEVDEEIRPEHFAAVAAAIQFVDRVNGKT